MDFNPQLSVVIGERFKTCACSVDEAERRLFRDQSNTDCSLSAQEAGIFAKNGLEVSVVRTRADVAVMSMLAGDTALIDVVGPIVIRSGLKGVDNVFIAAGAVTFNYWLMAAKAINTPQDLRGKIIGIAG